MNLKTLTAVAVVGLASGLAFAAPVEVRVTVRNLAPTNSVSFAPLRVGFGNGTFDAFNNLQSAFLLGQPSVATAPIVTVAEGGSGSTWLPTFAAVEPNATIGSVVPSPAGPLLPGATAMGTFIVDPMVNRFFTFGSMVVPSNDHFIGNDSPTEYMLFDASGNLVLNSISQFGNEVWDAGSEVTSAANAAFLVGGVNAQRIDEGGVVNFNFDRLDAFNGLTTAAGYTFNRQFGASDEIYRITFEVIPAPSAAALLGLGGLCSLRRRRA